MHQFSEFMTWFVRHGYWMFNLGVLVGIGQAIGAWYLVQYMQEWKERHNFHIWQSYKKPNQAARAASAGRISA